MLNNDKTTEIYYIVDEFCQEFEKVKDGHVLPENTGKKKKSHLQTIWLWGYYDHDSVSCRWISASRALLNPLRTGAYAPRLFS